MSDGFASDAAYSVFEGLRAGPDETLDRVAFATYSLDLVTVVACVLALSGDGDSGLDAGPLRLLDALEAILPRIDIVHQKDRLRAASRHHQVLHLLDGRLHAIQPPRGCSFHPKLALARYLRRGGKPAWRLWIGSRNLTASEDREAGLLLCGAIGGARGTRRPEIASMALDLLKPISWIAQLRSELAAARWSSPEGTSLRSLQWRTAGERSTFKLFSKASRVLAISPFADAAGCEHVFSVGKQRRLLTVKATADLLGPIDGLDVRVASAPDLQAAHMLEPSLENSDDGPARVEPVGLHAKLLAYDSGGAGRLYIGSANLTRRGLAGPNAEVVAELHISEDIVTALHNFALCHAGAHPSPPDAAADASRAAERALDGALQAVLEARFALQADDDGVTLSTEDRLDQFLIDHTLECWLLTRPDEPVEWGHGDQVVQISTTPLPLRLQTVLVCFSAAPRSDACPARSWAQVVDFPEFDRAARDLAAKADFVRLAGASAWLRGQLEGILPPESASCSSLETRRVPGTPWASSGLPLALEEVLAAWARDPDAFEAKIEPIDAMLAALGTEARRQGAQEPEVATEWEKLESFWRAIRASLGGPKR